MDLCEAGNELDRAKERFVDMLAAAREEQADVLYMQHLDLAVKYATGALIGLTNALARLEAMGEGE